MESMFWMGGKLATGLLEISDDVTDMRKPGLWAVVGSFENQWILARFANWDFVPLPNASPWSPLAAHDWSSSFSRDQYIAYVNLIRDQISSGEVYQVNACRMMQANNLQNKSLLSLMHLILKHNPAPFAMYLSLPQLQLASASPERFLSYKNHKVLSSPIKGTSATKEFLEKDSAENLMIVDLIRNDLGIAAKTGTVHTPRLLATEKHPGLFHLVSDVAGEIADGKDLVDVLRAMMPPGSVSGAPKSTALRLIREHEGNRGPYCGALGWVQTDETGIKLAELAVGIRTFWQGPDQVIKFGTGAGITWGSDPVSEWEETELKAQRLMKIANGLVGDE